MHLVARVRWTLARHPSIYWLAIGACAVLAAASVHRIGREAAAARDRWGTAVEVAVADSGVPRGQPLRVTMQAMPAAALPEGALTSLPPAGTAAARDIPAHAIVTDLDLAVAATVPDGWVTIALDAAAPALIPGDQVALIGGGALLCDGTVAGTPGDGAVDISLPAPCAARASTLAEVGELMLGRRG